MKFETLIAELERFPAVLRLATAGWSREDLTWRPDPSSWSVLEVVGHMAHEEIIDFRTRVAATLRDPSEGWDSIDPEGAIRAERMNEADLTTVLDQFERERADSVSWLRSLSAPEWDNAYEHPELGTLRAGDLLAAWTAHDAIHLRQIANLNVLRIKRDSGRFSTGYSGE